MVRVQLHNLENSMIMGVIFVILVLFYFLGTRNALFVGLAIPMSMFLSFIILSMLGYKINLIVLFSLILALGLVSADLSVAGNWWELGVILLLGALTGQAGSLPAEFVAFARNALATAALVDTAAIRQAGPVFSDNHAPVERVVHEIILSYLQSGD